MILDLSKRGKQIFYTLIAIDTILLVLHFVFGLGASLDLFHLDRERNIPSYYSGLKLISIAALAFCVLLLSSRKERFVWGLFSTIFTALSFDEISELHENVTYYINKVLSIPVSGFFRSPTHNWLFFFSPIILAILVFFFLQVKKIPDISKGTKRLLLSAFLLFGIALSLEFFGGIIRTPFYFRILAAIEEYAEMIGATLALTGFFSIVYIRFTAAYRRIDQ